MKKETKSYKIEIFGEHYLLMSDETEFHIKESALLVDSLMKDIATKSSLTDNKMIAVLAALRLASERNHLKETVEQKDMIESDLAQRIEQALNS